MAIIGLAPATGGGYLVAVGGSRYFLLMGLAMTLAAVLILCRWPAGVLALLVTLAYPQLGARRGEAGSRRGCYGLAALLAICLAGGLIDDKPQRVLLSPAGFGRAGRRRQDVKQRRVGTDSRRQDKQRKKTGPASAPYQPWR